MHRNNVYAGLIGVLQARYPVIERLVGEELFAGAARLFIAASPPSSPVLLEYGEGFAGFLADFEPAACVPYLPDVARLEWLRHAAFHAADYPPLTTASLAGAAGREGELIFEAHPSFGLISSPFPAVSIWETNAHDAEVRPIGPDMPGEAALIVRPGLSVNVCRLGPGEHAFAVALVSEEPLAAAVRTASAAAAFSLPHALARLIGAGAFSGYRFAEGN